MAVHNRYCDDYDYEEDYYDCIATTATRRLYYYCDDYHDGADDYKFNYDYRPLLLNYDYDYCSSYYDCYYDDGDDADDDDGDDNEDDDDDATT